MSSVPSQKPVLDFLLVLRENNNKAWFDSHRADYEQARAAFAALIEYLISELEEVQDLRGITAKDCIFRINRDVRFAKDKSPYKTNFGANIVPGGKKSGDLGYYVHLAPHDNSFIAGGLYMPSSEQLAKFRRAIAEDARPFKRIMKNKDFVRYFGAIEGERLSTAPQGYARDHPEIDLLRLKSVVVRHPLTDKQVLSPRFPAQVMPVMTALKPFSDYLSQLIAE